MLRNKFYGASVTFFSLLISSHSYQLSPFLDEFTFLERERFRKSLLLIFFASVYYSRVDPIRITSLSNS